MATFGSVALWELPRMAQLYMMECLNPREAVDAGLTCKAMYESSNYDWLWRQFYQRRWLFRGRGGVNKDAFARRYLSEKGMEEGKASQYSVTTMRGGAMVNAVQVRDQDVFVGYDDGRVLVWDASTGGREPRQTLATLPGAVQHLFLHKQSHLVAVAVTAVMVWELSTRGIQLLWEQRFDAPITSADLSDNTHHMILGFESHMARAVHIISGVAVEIGAPLGTALSGVCIEAEPSQPQNASMEKTHGAAADGSHWSQPVTAFVVWERMQLAVFKKIGDNDFMQLPTPPAPPQAANLTIYQCKLIVTHSSVTLLVITAEGAWYTVELRVAARSTWCIVQSHFPADFAPVSCVALEGRLLAVGIRNGLAFVYCLNTGARLHTLSTHSGAVTTICLDGNKCLTGGADKCMKVWRLHGPQPPSLYVLLGGSRNTGARDHPQRPGCSSIVLDDDRVVASFADVLRVYSFAV